jgi:uncharacterized protein YjiS (DUF1127 family)
MAQARRLVSGPAARGSVGRRVANMAQRAWTRYWTRRAEHATIGILCTLDDRTLKDIGLDRSEIESVVYGPCRGERRISWVPAGKGRLAARLAAQCGFPGRC